LVGGILTPQLPVIGGERLTELLGLCAVSLTIAQKHT
jgi:hypothetical protein